MYYKHSPVDLLLVVEVSADLTEETRFVAVYCAVRVPTETIGNACSQQLDNFQG